GGAGDHPRHRGGAPRPAPEPDHRVGPSRPTADRATPVTRRYENRTSVSQEYLSVRPPAYTWGSCTQAVTSGARTAAPSPDPDRSALASSTSVPSGRRRSCSPRFTSTSTVPFWNASTESRAAPGSPSTQASEPAPRSHSARSRSAARYSSSVEPGRPCWAPRAKEAQSSGCGSQVAPAGENPHPAAPAYHRSGTRQPSRPFSSPWVRKNAGS